MDNDTQEFMERLGECVSEKRHRNAPLEAAQPPTSDEGKCLSSGDDSQWAIMPNGLYMPWGATASTLPAGVYGCEWKSNILCFSLRKILTDVLLRLPDTASDRVLEGIKKFWESRERFQSRGQLFKRGVLLYGPPGGGKTATVTLLMQDLVERGGIVVIVENTEMASVGLRNARRVEPNRPIICVLEDLDEIISRCGESALLALLDGENQVDNVVFVATTNYPEYLDPRIVNRPSRFDEVIKIGMPSAEARRVYLEARTERNELTLDDITKWVEDTEGMSIAHLREMVIAVFCLGRTYEETLDRLRAMRRNPKSTQEKIPGFAGHEFDIKTQLNQQHKVNGAASF